MKLRSIEQAEVEGKRVLVRCGFDAPLDNSGRIADDCRIRECLPTIEFLIAHRAKIILCGHNGRPKGKVVPHLKMDATAIVLEQLLGRKVDKLSDCIGEEVKRHIGNMQPTSIVLLENLRFHKEEETNNPAFAKALASLADVYVDEAFPDVHREHASMVGIPALLPSYAGFRLLKEVEALSRVTSHPEHPFIAIIGGAKISDKITVIKRMLEIGDYVLLGGALANTILKAQGVSVGKSLIEEDMMEIAKELTLLDNRLRVPVDVVVAKEINANAETTFKAVANVRDDEYILDVGPDTVKLYGMMIQKAKMVVWGGPMGYYELKQFAKGTCEIAKSLADSKAYSVAGGGDTLDAIKESGFKDKISFISTGGGAMLSFLEGKTMLALTLLQ